MWPQEDRGGEWCFTALSQGTPRAEKLEEARRAPSLEALEGTWPEDTLM